MQRAMQRRGHAVFAVDPYAVLRGNRWVTAWAWRTGTMGISRLIERHIRQSVGDGAFDVAFVDNGELVSASAVKFLRARAGRVALFNRDNPFVSRDGMRWRTLRTALRHYDLYATPRQSTAEIARAAGVKHVLRVNFFADEVLHRPQIPTAEEQAQFGSPVSFVGSWFAERGPFMETLARRGVPLKVIGQRWERADNFAAFRHVVVPGYLDSAAYSAAVRSAEIAICMLSKGNQDLQTSRSSEIPAMGVVLCAERTAEHMAMYVEGEEALFWSSAEECADLCLGLLADPARLARIAAGGRRRVLTNDNWAETTMEQILLAAVGEVALS
ncbi:MAG: glycosyltransferase [Candidatus Devosia phytovorans]|uniref:Glycosyltransferase n=1 Tax=Candidatus Devosia phytovorans TaxID=3121372 RepID=A0AAJ5VWG1_9HYPH|nr:glycosyltransferase [Devosia sp.]WEK05682.1 MAG: glycosyltransferase [Devosia sp.]